MAATAKKDKSLPTRKEAIGKRPWPNLPQQLLNFLARKPNLLNQMSYPGTTKSWSATTKRCNSTKLPQHPQLHELEGSNKWCCLSKTLPQFINIYFRTEIYHWWYYMHRSSPPHFWLNPTQHFVSYSRGSVICRGPNPSDLYIFELLSRCEWQLHPWDVDIPFKFVAISSPHYVVVVTGISSPALIAHSHIEGGYKWIKYEFDTIDPYDSKNQSMKFTNVIGFEGKFYALSLQGALAVIEEIGSRLVVTSVAKNRAVPSLETRYFREYLLESNGEILLVFLIYKKTLGVVDQVEVFKLSFPRLTWIKLESLQGRALYLENECCIWVDSRQVGCRGNCVYFTKSSAAKDEWCKYDMETGCISPGLAWKEPTLEE